MSLYIQAYDTNVNRIIAADNGQHLPLRRRQLRTFLSIIAADNGQHLPLRRRQLRTFLSIIAKSCDIHHYNIVTRHSTSLQWIYAKLREDYDIQQKGIHFFNLLDLKFESGTNVVGFYNQYRNLIIANLKKRGDRILWQDAEMEQDKN